MSYPNECCPRWQACTCLDVRPAFDRAVLDMLKTGSWWASVKLAIEVKCGHHAIQMSLRRLKRRGLVRCESQLWRAATS